LELRTPPRLGVLVSGRGSNLQAIIDAIASGALEAFPNRILNIHPSLLPAFRGLDAQKQALAFGVKITGATVHVVTAALDDGPILMQAAVPVLPGDTVDTLSARILVEEHRIYPRAIASVLSGTPQPLAPSPQPLAPSPQPLAPSPQPLVDALPFSAAEPIKVVELHAGESDITRAIRSRFPHATIKTFGEKFNVASLDWWDAMFGADVVIAAHIMPKLTDAKKQYLYKAVADRASARGGIIVLDRVDGTSSQLFHQLMWMKHAGFGDVDCRWLQDGLAVFGGFTPRQAAASAPPLPAGN